MPEDTMSVRDAVRWAADNCDAIIKRRPVGLLEGEYDWDAAKCDPPNALGRNYVVFAAEDRMGFLRKIVPQFLGKDEDKADVSDEEVKRDEKSIAEMRKLLKRFTEEG